MEIHLFINFFIQLIYRLTIYYFGCFLIYKILYFIMIVKFNLFLFEHFLLNYFILILLTIKSYSFVFHLKKLDSCRLHQVKLSLRFHLWFLLTIIIFCFNFINHSNLIAKFLILLYSFIRYQIIKVNYRLVTKLQSQLIVLYHLTWFQGK